MQNKYTWKSIVKFIDRAFSIRFYQSIAIKCQTVMWVYSKYFERSSYLKILGIHWSKMDLCMVVLCQAIEHLRYGLVRIKMCGNKFQRPGIEEYKISQYMLK